MELVSDNSDEEIARQRALQDLRWPMKDLAANLLRVVRGAGRPYELGPQMVEVLDALQAYKEVVGYYPSSQEIGDTINIRDLNNGRPFDDMSLAVDVVVQGALQKAASQLVGQSTQEAAGKSEMFVGIREIETIRQKNTENLRPFTEHSGRSDRAQMAKRAKKLARPRGKSSRLD